MELPTNNATNNDSTVSPSTAAVYASRQNVIGVATLILLFCGSACVTLVYFSDVPGIGSTAAVASAATTEANTDAFAEIQLQARAAYVKDLATNKVLYTLHSDTQLPLASLTKIATVLAVSEVLPSDTVITIPRDTAPYGSVERLAAGQKWLLHDVTNFTLVASSNGGAEILAEAANGAIHAKYPQSPEVAATLWRMNDLARTLHLDATYFLNASGLDISTTLAGAYGSAHDIADLFAYAASHNPGIFEGTARDGMLLTSVDGSHTSAYNTDQALGSIPGLVMGKTGYTDLAGGNLAILFDIGLSHPVVAVILGSSYDGRFADMKKLIAASQVAVSQEH